MRWQTKCDTAFVRVDEAWGREAANPISRNFPVP